MRPFYRQHKARLWLGESVRRPLTRLTEQLGGPARSQVIVLLGLVLALSSADNTAVGAVAVQLEPGLRIGPAELGLLVTVSSLVGALFSLPFGILIDKTRRVPLLTIGVVAWGIVEAVSGFSTSFAALMLARLVLGAVTAIAVPMVASLTGDFFPARERGRVYGYIITGEIAGAGFGIGVASLIAGMLGWRAAFIILALPSFVLAWMLWRDLPEPARGGQSHFEQPAPQPEVGERVAAAPDRMSSWQVVRYVLRVRSNVVIIIASSLGYLFLAGLRTFAVLFARGHFHAGQGLATLLLGIIGAGAVVGLLTAGGLADRLMKRGRVDGRIWVAAVAYLAASLLLLPALLTANLAWSLLLFVVAGVMLAAPYPPLDAAQLDVVPAQVWGRAQGVRSALRSTLEAFGPLLFGMLAGAFVAGHRGLPTSSSQVLGAAQMRGLQVAFLLMLVPLAGAGVLLLRGRRQYVVDAAAAATAGRQAGAS